jgi:hypothetical protein
MPPTPGDVILAIIAVTLGTIAAATAVYAGIRGRNWLAWVCALGCTGFVAGVVAQRVFPTADAIKRLGNTAAAASRPGPWDAGVSLPFVTIRLTPVAVAGLLVAAVGLSLVLLFERVSEAGPRAIPVHRRLEEEDTV